MNWITGGVMFAATLFLVLKFRPREAASRELCAVCALMAAVTPVAPGATWFLQAVSILTKAVALFCCCLQLWRERRRRRKPARRPAGKKTPCPGNGDFQLPAA